ncbi:hypothetical protein SBA4_790003 [Candidatus Sulfopaludibacter sp. SbA4]|nr:hypothetical protein SBA4_790003 [Candidatus Sulfopaludibacter sp. SbA4]
MRAGPAVTRLSPFSAVAQLSVSLLQTGAPSETAKRADETIEVKSDTLFKFGHPADYRP